MPQFLKRLSFAIILGLAGCNRSCAPQAIPLSMSHLRVQLTAEPVSLDPALVEDGLSLRVLANVMDGLVGYDGAGVLENRLAESYTVSPDGLQYHFKLRPGTTWSDGKAVTVQDFIAGIRRALRPGSASKLASLLFPIKGAHDFHAGLSPDLPGLRPGLGEESGGLVVELEQPTSYFIQVLTLPVAYPIREEVLAVNEGHWPTTAPVTGPYRILTHVPEQKLVLDMNPNYWRPFKGIRTVELLVIQDEATGVNLFEQGKIDILTRIPSLDYPRFKQMGVLHTDPFMATYYVSFNTRKPPFNDRAWRRAAAGAIDRPGITTMLGSGETPARSWIPKGLEGYEDYVDSAPAFTGASLKNAAVPVEITAAFDSSTRNSAIMEKIQSDLKSRLHWNVELSNLDWKSYIKSLQADPPSIYRFAWLAPFKDPISHLQAFTGANPNNYSGWSSPKYDELVQQIQTISPGVEREKKIQQAQALLVDQEAVVIPIYHYVQNHAVSPRVRGFRVNPFGMIRFDELQLDAGTPGPKR